MTHPSHSFSADERHAVYRAIRERRDMRRFRPEPIPDKVLSRILVAAHQAPSVGFMQPWDFILIRDVSVRERIHADFLTANAEATAMFEGSRREQYASLKLEGIRESPLNICVTCDRKRFGPIVLGRTCQPDMDLYSVVCAVQNLWLAARVESIGVGWVSILHAEVLTKILRLPEGVIPVAYLCMGYVAEFPQAPELETAGWLERMPMEKVLHHDGW